MKALAVTSDIALLILGGKLKRLERLSARLGDVFSHLYLASAVLKYYKDDEENIESNKLYAIWCLKNSLYESQEALIDFWDNFPNRFLGGLFRKIIFIWGRAYKKPDDKLEQQIAEVMTTPNPLRDKLTKDCYLGETVKSLDKAFQKLIVVTPILEKLQNASRQGTLPKSAILTERIELAKDFGILDAKEIIAITEYNELRIRAIMVDDFASDELARQS